MVGFTDSNWNLLMLMVFGLSEGVLDVLDGCWTSSSSSFRLMSDVIFERPLRVTPLQREGLTDFD